MCVEQIEDSTAAEQNAASPYVTTWYVMEGSNMATNRVRAFTRYISNLTTRFRQLQQLIEVKWQYVQNLYMKSLVFLWLVTGALHLYWTLSDNPLSIHRAMCNALWLTQLFEQLQFWLTFLTSYINLYLFTHFCSTRRQCTLVNQKLMAGLMVCLHQTQMKC